MAEATESVPPTSGERSTAEADDAHEKKRLGKLAYLVSRKWFLATVIGLLFMGPIAGSLSREVPDPLPVHGTLAPFSMTDQHGHTVDSEKLKGKIWVANFIFTSCPSICVRLSFRMKNLQHRTRHLATKFHMVSFSVDPENDTPERLLAYSKRFRASRGRWSFLTGKLSAVEKTVVKGFKLAMGRDAKGFDQVFHSEKFVLVDQQGRIRGYYDATDEGINKLIRDIGLITLLG